VKVEYSEETQRSRCEGLVQKVAKFFSDNEFISVCSKLHPDSFNGLNSLVNSMQDLLIEEILTYKHSAFSEEKEWRLVVRAREHYKQGTDDGGRTPPLVHFRESMGYPVPYVRLLPLRGTLPIKTVRSGPSLDFAHIQASVGLLLSLKGYSEVELLGSDVPVVLR
jgi:hypothetical protein